MMKKLMITMAVVATATVLHAGAPVRIDTPMTQAVGNWYVGAYGGMNFMQDGIQGYRYWRENADTSISKSKKIGWDAGLKVGYDFDPAATVRPVLEAEWLVSGFNQDLKVAGEDWWEKQKTNTLTTALMVNALAKFNAGAFQPYFGAGAGFYHMSMDAKNWCNNHKTYHKDFGLNAAGFAWQAIAGTDFKLDANWALFVEYKWLAMHIPDAKNKPWERDGYTKSLMAQQQVNLGVRYSF